MIWWGSSENGPTMYESSSLADRQRLNPLRSEAQTRPRCFTQPSTRNGRHNQAAFHQHELHMVLNIPIGRVIGDAHMSVNRWVFSLPPRLAFGAAGCRSAFQTNASVLPCRSKSVFGPVF
jgi:hypothetical protein